MLLTLDDQWQCLNSANDGKSAVQVRSFAPAQGVPEDPICGSGNASVAAFLIHCGLIEEVGREYVARQGCKLGAMGRLQYVLTEIVST